MKHFVDGGDIICIRLMETYKFLTNQKLFCELIGIPTIVIVGKGLANGVIEVRDRWAGTSSEIPVEGVETQLLKMVGK